MHSREVIMRRLACLALLLVAIPAVAQYPEVDAAVDALMAKDLPALAKHLPPELEKGLAGLPTKEQRELSEEMLPLRILGRQGIAVKRSDSPDGIVVVEPTEPNERKIPSSIIKLDKRISDGSECLLRLSFRTGSDDSDQFQVWMKYVDSEWRIYELEEPGGRLIKLDAPDFLARRRHTDLNSNESSAVGSMRSYNTAAITYTSSYPDIGFPKTAEDLGASRYGTDVDEHHAGLVDNMLSNPPFEKNGYRFTFKGEREKFTLIGRPIKFGVSGNRSFFSNESCVIRFTDEDREATEKDGPLQ
jgi:type IV pilus assembly protein PilA